MDSFRGSCWSYHEKATWLAALVEEHGGAQAEIRSAGSRAVATEHSSLEPK